MTLANPIGSGITLKEFIADLCEAVNKSYNLRGDARIHVEQGPDGRSISFVEETRPFFAQIVGWRKFDEDASGKRWKYSWEEVTLGTRDLPVATDRKKGHHLSPTEYLINLAEIGNTTGAEEIQGNGMLLVAPIGGGRGGEPEHKTVVPVWTSRRSNGSTVYWTNVVNSDHIGSSSYQNIGSHVVNDESHTTTSLEDDYELEDVNSGDHTAGVGLRWQVDARTNYTHTDTSPKLRSFYRKLMIRPNGKIESVLRENVTIVDSPVVCIEPEE